MKRLLTLTFRVNEQDMFYSYPVQPVHQLKKINYDEFFTAKRFSSVRI